MKDRGGGRSQCGGERGAGAPEDPQHVQGQGGGGVEHLGEDPHLGQGMAARTPSEMQLQYIRGFSNSIKACLQLRQNGFE